MKSYVQRKEALGLIAISLTVLLLVYYGWRLFWFLTDDAYIAFRYVSNSILGYGYVWNPPPFMPVEGYSSFLWVVLLDITWRITGIQPPDIANSISLIFSCLSLLLGGLMILKMKLNDSLRRHRVFLLGLVLVGVISNRTFLAWTSSGLETAMFNFFITLWIYCCLFVPPSTYRWSLSVGLAALLIHLSRPEGLLFVFVTIGLIGINLTTKREHSITDGRDFLGFIPLMGVLMHMIWRYCVYSEWLPNTFYAKWSPNIGTFGLGGKYALSFIIEYSLWFWLGTLVALIIVKKDEWKRQLKTFFKLKSVQQHQFKSIVTLLVFLTVLIHFLYYTLVVGGDHFEYRVYSYMILLLFISFLFFLSILNANMKLTVIMVFIFFVTSLPIPWLHWAISRDLITLEDTTPSTISIADDVREKFPLLPHFTYEYLEYYDSIQLELFRHGICIRHQQHKEFLLGRMDYYPGRFEEHTKTGDEYPIMVAHAVGIVSWAFPNVSILDTFGLNDYVIARNQNLRSGMYIAHQRKPPAGYLECFLDGFEPYQIYYVPEDRIIECENKYWAKLKQ
jgi:arabinofuranosyltransferase